MLTAIVCAILTGARGYRTIAHWVRSQNATVRLWLGFHRKPPCANSFRNLLLALNPEVLETILRQWMTGCKEIAATLRDFCYRPRKLLQFLCMKN